VNKIAVLMAIIFLVGCSRNVEFVKERAAERWSVMGFQVLGYEGYKWSPLCGGDVWHLLKRADSPGIIYSGYLCKWGDELHVYGPRVVSGHQVGLISN